MTDPVNSSDEAPEWKRQLRQQVKDEIIDKVDQEHRVAAAFAIQDAYRLIYPAVAAAVRAEAVADPDAQPCTSCEEPTGNPDTFCDACKLDELENECDRLRAKLAEAVADERRRVKELVRTELLTDCTQDPGDVGYNEAITDVLAALAAGSVPVATPEPTTCTCDGAVYFTPLQNAARKPFLRSPDCPVHSVAIPKPTVCEFCRRADGGHERSCLTNLPESLVATPPAEPADDEDETPTGKVTQSEAEALRTKAQPVPCEHGKTKAHNFWPEQGHPGPPGLRRCRGPVPS